MKIFELKNQLPLQIAATIALSISWFLLPTYDIVSSDVNGAAIFINGALHHLDDTTVKNINKLSDIFTNSYFLSVDPVKSNNKIFNKLMIKFDRGKFIRNKDDYSNLMTSSKNIILDDFYKMSFKQILHYRNFELNDFYLKWKNSID